MNGQWNGGRLVCFEAWRIGSLSSRRPAADSAVFCRVADGRQRPVKALDAALESQ
jgi:hypothetical protein